jgi:hypothetical protein
LQSPAEKTKIEQFKARCRKTQVDRTSEEQAWRVRAADGGFLLGFAIVGFTGTLLLLISLTFLLGQPISRWHVPAAAGATWAEVVWAAGFFFPDRRRRIAGGVIAATLIVALAAVGFSSLFYDLSWDGQSYHQEGIIQLAKGWNPVTQLNPPEHTNHDMELVHWAKGNWLYGASIYRLTGMIEHGKCFHMLFLVASFLFALAAILRIPSIPPFFGLGIAAVAALNPVSLSQSVSFYVDGEVASLLTALAALLVFAHPRWNPPTLACLALICVILVNLKATAIGYLAVFVGGYVLWRIFSRRTEALARILVVAALASIAGVGWVGYNPYVTNWLHKGHPFFPFAGPGSFYFTLLMKGQRPANFEDENRCVRLVQSVFSRTENAATPRGSRWKWPFAIHGDELPPMREGYGTRVGGWGALFGGSILLAVLILVGASAASFRDSSAAWWAVGCVTASACITSEGWWARFAPQLYLIPIIAVILAWRFHRPWLRRTGTVLLIVLFGNGVLLGGLYLSSNFRHSRELDIQLGDLAARRARVVVYFDWFRSNRVRLADHGIRWREVSSADQLPCGHPERWVDSLALYCTDPSP